ncbi:DUF4398 domain-containing protein [Aquincola sp. S2]|uniref:DUF4398 domain-containing protein n=1 Tax=Pseudaquabacterium terrae TaxID=2732868 RepID=A0ABX2ECM7_9BURK|nr:DUF4398 domain-containing protein [Aquabacterium terrae]NRF65590.1 DUF4398 domain-containing protein [Aquabacterium terrae]
MNDPAAKLPRWLRSPLWAAAAVVLVSGCASTGDAPNEQMAVSRAAVERASGSNAAEAPVELASARDKMARAQIAFANKDYVQARQLAEQAEAEANLAEAQARSVRANRALAEVRESIRQLRAEMARAPA